MQRKIAFMGTPNFAVPILKYIYQNGYEISAVYTQPPKKSNRGQRITKSPIHILSETLNLNIRTPEKLLENTIEYEYIKKINLDLAIVVSYGQIIPKDYLKLSKNNFINIHASILPKWRGAAPIQRSIINLDKKTGISIMKINEKLDEGDVSKIFKLNILENENAQSLSERLSVLASDKITDIIDNIFEGNVNYRAQEHSNATYAKKIDKSEGIIEWKEDAEKIIGKINGLYPSPGCFFIFKSERYKILKAERSFTEGDPGTIINDRLEICCGKESIKILEIQREGKKAQKISEFITGSKIIKGTKL